MENNVCCKCGRKNPENIYRFLAVDVKTSSSTQYQGGQQVTTTVTNEKLAGADKIYVCDKCIQKQRIIDAFFFGFCVLFICFIIVSILYLWLAGNDNDHIGTGLLVVLILSTVAGVFMFIHSMKEDKEFLAASILKKIKGKDAATTTYVPVNADLYRKQDGTGADLDRFKRRTGLKTNLADSLLTSCISLGIGNALVDQLSGVKQPSTIDANTTELLSIYLDIDKLGDGAYGLAAGQEVAKALPVSMVEGMSFLSGDSNATLRGNANEYVVGIRGNSAMIGEIESKLRSDERLKGFLSASGIRRGSYGEPLVDDGVIKGGTIVNPPGHGTSFCAHGLRTEWAKATKQ